MFPKKTIKLENSSFPKKVIFLEVLLQWFRTKKRDRKNFPLCFCCSCGKRK